MSPEYNWEFSIETEKLGTAVEILNKLQTLGHTPKCFLKMAAARSCLIYDLVKLTYKETSTAQHVALYLLVQLILGPFPLNESYD